MGEPASIGPDIIVKLAQKLPAHPLMIIGDRDLLQERAKQMQLPFNHDSFQFHHIPLNKPCTAGKLDVANANYVLKTLEIAAFACLDKQYDAVVTCPVNKQIINDAGVNFSGQTEFFAKLCHSNLPVMMLTTPGLHVALVTTHLPLTEVPAAITSPRLEDIIKILCCDLKKRFGINQPKILVCGLNPHAGEGGYLGREEIEVISPTLDKLRNKGYHLTGPVAADTAFSEKNLAQHDVVLAMYHDQGLPVLKYKGFTQAANITLGLSIIRTSVDHGTALEIAGSGYADENSLRYAINTAADMVKHSQ